MCCATGSSWPVSATWLGRRHCVQSRSSADRAKLHFNGQPRRPIAWGFALANGFLPPAGRPPTWPPPPPQPPPLLHPALASTLSAHEPIWSRLSRKLPVEESLNTFSPTDCNDASPSGLNSSAARKQSNWLAAMRRCLQVYNK